MAGLIPGFQGTEVDPAEASGDHHCVSDVAERFLKEERAHSGPRIDPVDRARFHRLVRLCAENWLRHALTGLRMSRGKP